MARRKKNDPEYQELLQKALEPFNPTLTKEKQLEHEAKIREVSIANIHKMKDDVSENEKTAIKARADFTHCWNG